jgi:cyclophilin family peptidyl-prolyl cis-trans isomerase
MWGCVTIAKLIFGRPIRRFGLLAGCFGLVLASLACQAAPNRAAVGATTSTGGSGPSNQTASAAAAPAGTTTGGTAVAKQWSSPPPMTIDLNKQYTAVIKTTDGDMTAELYAKDAPITVNNFVFLANQHFYDGVIFHRIIKGFMVQTGDPTGTGTGGPGYRFKDEPVKRPYTRGTLAMANAGPNTNGSQFFIMQQDNPLPPNYTIFGKLTAGLDVLDQIANTPVGPSPSGEMSAPKEKVTIESITIEVQ